MRTRGSEQHDGFYLRLQLGAGHTRISADSGSATAELVGTSGSFSLALGGAVVPNLIFYVALNVISIPNPELRLNGSSIGTATGDSSADVIGFGGGIAYYLEPANVFLAATLLSSRLVINDTNGNQAGESDRGFAFEGLLGKEWWVSDNWGIGGAAQVSFGTVKDHQLAGTVGDAVTWNLATFSVLFSATYN